jgi:subtilisin family serine protease
MAAKRSAVARSFQSRAVAAAMGPARTIVYVHGIGRKPPASVLKAEWDRALYGFDLGEHSRLAYWARETVPVAPRAAAGAGALPVSDEEPSAPTVERSLEDEVADITTDPEQRRVLVALGARLEGGPTGPRALDAYAEVLPLPPFLRRPLVRLITRAFLRDVHDYFFNEARRQHMRRSVLERLDLGAGPFVVIGHSQGSMIAYDVLSRLDPGAIQVPLFVTAGSPLGLSEVKDFVCRLTGQRRLECPRCVARWVNVADPLDPVALDEDLADEYAAHGRLEDRKVRNPAGPRHPHAATGYLATEPVRAAVRDVADTALFQPVGDFVIARDVARSLEDAASTDRHKVLIELVDEDNQGSGTLDNARAALIGRIRRIASPDEDVIIEPLRRFVAAELTRGQIEALATSPDVGPRVRRIWRNAIKHALLDVSANTVQATAAHAGYRATGRDITWAVLDTGVAADHPHFGGQVVAAQFDCTRRGALVEGQAPDGNGHGTHVAGIIAGRLELGTPAVVYSGMAPEARLHVYKVLSDAGSGEDAWIIKALDHIADTNERAGELVIHGLNLSLGGGFDPSAYGCGHSPLCRELRRLWRQGVVVVIAAGNGGFAQIESASGPLDANLDLSISDPANLDEAIAVGSVHKERPHSYGVSYFSSRGPTADGRLKPDVVAPGERIVSCRHRWAASVATADNLYVAQSGTSMAAPHVSGVVAAFLSCRREFIGVPEEVKAFLKASCTDLGRDRLHQGAGMPNLVKMLLAT